MGTLADVDDLVAAGARATGSGSSATWSPTTPRSTTPGSSRPARGGPGHPARGALPRRAGRDDAPPSDWQSLFGGPAWEPFGDGEWYLHLFDVEQPDLNWDHPDVAADLERTVRFWLDRGFDGLRFDAAGALAKAPGYPPAPPGAADTPATTTRSATGPRCTTSAAGSRGCSTSTPGRFGVAEVWGPAWVGEPFVRARTSCSRRSRWTSCSRRSTPRALGATVRDYLDAAGRQGPASRLAARQPRRHPRGDPVGSEGSLAVLLLLLALPGATYLYAGDELGLPEVRLPRRRPARPDLAAQRAAPSAAATAAGCRCPGPPPPTHAHGFSADPPLTNDGSPWLPQPPGWGERSVRGAGGRPGVAAGAGPGGAGGAHATCVGARGRSGSPSEDDLLVFRRGDVTCVLTTGDRPVPLAGWGGELLATSRPLDAARTAPGPRHRLAALSPAAGSPRSSVCV